MLISLLKDLVAGVGRRGATVTPVDPEPGSPELTYRRGGAVVAFVAGSEGDALKQHTLEMVKPLRPYCGEVFVIDVRDPGWRSSFDSAARKPIWFAMSPFGGGELFLSSEDRTVSPWARAGIPFIRLFGDLPAYFPAAHVQSFPNSINAYGHVEHLEFFLRWFAVKAPALAQPLFPFDCVQREAVDRPRKVSTARILFPKNGNDPDQLVAFWRAQLPPAVQKVLEDICDDARCELDEPFDIMAALERHFALLSIDVSGCRHLLFFLTAQVDDYLRRFKSTLIARSVLDLPVTIRGVNWEHLDFRGRRAVHDPSSDYDTTRYLLDEAIAVIDMSPNTHRGAHDRVLRAAGRYTAFLTNRTRFFSEHFEGADQFTFRFDADSIRRCVERAIERPGETVEMGFRQATRLREQLTEEHYVAQLVAVVDACALACGSRPEGTQSFVDFAPWP